jgi:ribosomal protein L37E
MKEMTPMTTNDLPDPVHHGDIFSRIEASTASQISDTGDQDPEPPRATWCQTCGNPVQQGKCACWCLVADTLQRYLGYDFDASADMAARMWNDLDDADHERVWSAEYAATHDVPTYPQPGRCCQDCDLPLVKGEGEESEQWRTAGSGRYFCAESDDALHHLPTVGAGTAAAQDALDHPHDDPCPRCGRRQWTDENNPETCQACGVAFLSGEVDHTKCDPFDHDRSFEGAGPDQKVADDGLLGCNDCGRPVYYCDNDGRYHHVNPDDHCWLVDCS